MRELIANTMTPGAVTSLGELLVDINSSAASMEVTSPAPTALRGSEAQFRVRIDSEWLIVQAPTAAQTKWTILERGAEGSTAAGHLAGAKVTHELLAGGLQAFIEATLPSVAIEEWIRLPHQPDWLVANTTHLYWGAPGTAIGRVSYGGEREDEWLVGAEPPLAADDTYVYTLDEANEAIARVTIATKAIELNWLPFSIFRPGSVVLHGEKIYVAISDKSTIGRANIDGSEPESEWLKILGNVLTTDGVYLYVSGVGVGPITRVRLDGTEPTEAWYPFETRGKMVAWLGQFLYWTSEQALSYLPTAGGFRKFALLPETAWENTVVAGADGNLYLGTNDNSLVRVVP